LLDTVCFFLSSYVHDEEDDRSQNTNDCDEIRPRFNCCIVKRKVHQHRSVWRLGIPPDPSCETNVEPYCEKYKQERRFLHFGVTWGYETPRQESNKPDSSYDQGTSNIRIIWVDNSHPSPIYFSMHLTIIIQFYTPLADKSLCDDVVDI
jgi:hypothetical protein